MRKISPHVQEIFDEICRRIRGGQRLRDICKVSGMPSQTTVWRWRKARPDLDALVEDAEAAARWNAQNGSAGLQAINDEPWAPAITQKARIAVVEEIKQELAASAEKRLDPLDVMLSRMARLWDNGNAPEDAQREACALAKDAAPYIHAKLSSVEAKVTHEDLRQVREDLLITELQVLASQLGDLTPPEVLALAHQPEPRH